MNKVILMGRLTKDPELNQTQSGTAYVRFTVAVSRRFAKDGQQQADFVSCVAWSKTAEFISKYFHKGNMIAVIGSIQTGSYQKDGQTVYTTDVAVNEVYFTGEKQKDSTAMPALPPSGGFDDFPDVPLEYDDDLPF